MKRSVRSVREQRRNNTEQRNRIIVEMCEKGEMSQDEIALMFHISQQRVSEIYQEYLSRREDWDAGEPAKV